MAITIDAFTGTETVTTTEWSLTADSSTIQDQTDDGVYQSFIDLNAMAAGDIFDLKIYEKATSGGTRRVVYYARFANAQATPIAVSPALVLGHGWDFSLLKISGTDRAITWRISKIA